MNSNAAAILDAYFKLHANLDSVRLAANERHFIDIINGEAFELEVRRRVKKLTGLIGGSYAVVDRGLGKATLIRSGKMNEDGKPIPCLAMKTARTFVKTVEDFKGAKKIEAITKAQLIDLMYEAENHALQLMNKTDYKSPFFLQNLPPYTSKYAFPPLPYEDRLRSLNKLSYLYCYTGEVVFHIYAWRWLFKYAQYAGFDAKINLEALTIPNRNTDSQDIWNLITWERNGFQDMPEIKWLKSISAEKAVDETEKKLKAYWNRMVSEYDAYEKGRNYNFQKKEWSKLGLTESTCSTLKEVFLATDSYFRHIVRSIEAEKIMKIQSKQKKLIKTGKDKIKTDVERVNELIDQVILAQSSKNLSEKQRTFNKKQEGLIKKIWKKGKENPNLMHYIYRKIIFEALIADMPLAREEVRVKDLLKEIHKKTRFPILPSFFQTLLSENRLPVEHYYFPIAKSFKLPFYVNLPYKNSTYESPVKNNNAIVACMNIKPVWAINTEYAFTHDKKFSSDALDVLLSDETFARLKVIRNYIELLSTHLVEYAFYESELEEAKEEAKEEKESEQFYMQAHEIRSLIASIRVGTPPYILDKIRLYFNVVFGANEQLIKSYYTVGGSSELHEKYDIGNNYKQLVSNASFIAAEIQVIEDLGRKDYKKVSESKFNEMVENIVRGIRISELLRMESTFTIKNMVFDLENEDEKPISFYFFSAVVTAIRNAIKHSGNKPKISIKYDINKKSLLITNTTVKSPLSKRARIHPGSTDASLKYFIKAYHHNGIDIKPQQNQENKELWETRIPIPLL